MSQTSDLSWISLLPCGPTFRGPGTPCTAGCWMKSTEGRGSGVQAHSGPDTAHGEEEPHLFVDEQRGDVVLVDVAHVPPVTQQPGFNGPSAICELLCRPMLTFVRLSLLEALAMKPRMR